MNSQDVSTGLARTKPIDSRRPIPSAKPAVNAEAASQDQASDEGLAVGTLEAPQDSRSGGSLSRGIRSSGLGENYQAAYAQQENICADLDASIDGGIPSSPPTVVPGDYARYAVNTDLNGLEVNTDPYIRAEPWSSDGDTFWDYVPPPSAQGDKVPNDVEKLPERELVGDSASSKQNQHDRYDSDEFFEDQDDQDSFPMDDVGLEDIMQSIEPHAPAALKNVIDDWGWNDTDDQSFMEDVDITIDLGPLHKLVSPSNSGRGGSTKSPNHIEPLAPMPFPKAQFSRILANTSGNSVTAKRNETAISEGSENCFDDDDLDEGLVDLAESSNVLQPLTPLTSPEKPLTPKLQWMPPKTFTPVKSSQIPVLLIDIPHLVPMNADGEALPFMRPPFPNPIRDRSPILGLRNRTSLRTCFRIGEALNAAAVASRAKTDAIIELYARVVSSEREDVGGFKQFFQFGDLFTDKPPYLTATYNLWKGVGLWNLDSQCFLGKEGKGKLARIMGRIKRRDHGGGCEMTIMSIWEVDWEEVGFAKGIVCS